MVGARPPRAAVGFVSAGHGLAKSPGSSRLCPAAAGAPGPRASRGALGRRAASRASWSFPTVCLGKLRDVLLATNVSMLPYKEHGEALRRISDRGRLGASQKGIWGSFETVFWPQASCSFPATRLGKLQDGRKTHRREEREVPGSGRPTHRHAQRFLMREGQSGIIRAP